MSRMKDIYTELESDASDMVNHPPHYTAHPSGVECIQITEHMNFCIGNAVKYLWRADEKGKSIEDLEKAAWYIQREITRRRDTETQLAQMNEALMPNWVRDELAKTLAKPSPLEEMFQQEQCDCETCVQARLELNERGFVVVPAVQPDCVAAPPSNPECGCETCVEAWNKIYAAAKVQSDEDEEIGVATVGENWFEVPLPGFGTRSASPVVPSENGKD